MQENKTIILSRTDSIGDVVLTLPLAHVLKEKFPGCKIIFLGKTYTKPVLECCAGIDQVLCWDEIEKQSGQQQLELFRSLKADCIVHVFPNKAVGKIARHAGIPIRIGTSHRLHHWFTCNYQPNFTRKNSNLHEAQLNFKLLESLGVNQQFSLEELGNYFDFNKVKPLSQELLGLLDPNRFNLILHPGSRGSAVEWGISNFSALAKILPKDKFKIFVTGTKQEAETAGQIFSENPEVIDLTGKLSLSGLISFIGSASGLVAASTGPLHLAAIQGIRAIGIYPSVRPIHPGRWAPIGKRVTVLTAKTSCDKCRKGENCDCLSSVKPEEVADVLLKDLK